MKEELNNKQIQWLKKKKEEIKKYDNKQKIKKINKILGGDKKLEKTIHREIKKI